MKIYVGLKEKAKPEIFESEQEANTPSHPKYDIVYGPFKSEEDAQRYLSAMGQGVACSEG
jgi:hypothetical protein